MSFTEALRFLDKHINLEARAGHYEGLSLDSMHELMTLSGDPHRAFRSIHVTGTNGKGSTGTMIARLLQTRGLKVGRYMSPHLSSITERIEIDGDPIGRDDFAAEILALEQLTAISEHSVSYFELLTAAAFRWFAEVAVDVAVVEVGVLGRFDATNVIESDVAVLTNIGQDHTDALGDWRRNIAWEKVGISKPSSTLVIGEPAPELLDIFEGEPSSGVVLVERDFSLAASELAVGGRLIDIRTRRGLYEDIFVAAHGEHQAENAAVALVAAEEFFASTIEDDVVAEAFGELRLPGRVEVVASAPVTILDGAHNPQAAAALAQTIAGAFGGAAPRVFVLAILSPRNPADFVAEVGIGPGDYVIAVAANSPRSVSTEIIAAAGEAVGAITEAAGDVEDALGRARILAGDSGMVVVTGSMYVVGEAREELV